MAGAMTVAGAVLLTSRAEASRFLAGRVGASRRGRLACWRVCEMQGASRRVEVDAAQARAGVVGGRPARNRCCPVQPKRFNE